MLRLYELSLSPNNTKIRMALRYKGVPFEAVEVPPMDRSMVVEVSGQELTPVIADKGIVLNDSEAILQYLDANYRDTPRLFPSDRMGRKACDAWKDELDRRLVPSWMDVFFFAIKLKPAMDPASPGRFRDALAALQDELGEDGTWKGADKPICDLRVAEWATYALPGAPLLGRVPLFGKLQELFGVAAGSLPRLEAAIAPWQERLG
ncbi:MAG: glutathione S-transferase family protein [Planctomycetota bacterium]